MNICEYFVHVCIHIQRGRSIVAQRQKEKIKANIYDYIFKS